MKFRIKHSNWAFSSGLWRECIHNGKCECKPGFGVWVDGRYSPGWWEVFSDPEEAGRYLAEMVRRNVVYDIQQAIKEVTK